MMTEFLNIDGGRIACEVAACEVAGEGPLVVLSPGAGHYPHAQCPGQVAALMTGFLESTAAAER